VSQFEDSLEIILSVVTHSLNKLGASGSFAGKLLENVESKSREVVLVEKKLNLQIIPS
jgi:hypothetical protein